MTVLSTSPSISVLLTAYRRPGNFLRQLEAIRRQTLPAREIVAYKNYHGNDQAESWGEVIEETEGEGCNCQWLYGSTNRGVWTRFMLACDFDTDYVAVFDDDTIPAPGWLSHVVATAEKTLGLYGAVGVIFKGGVRGDREYVFEGFDQPTQVDICGHCWVLPVDLLRKLMQYRHDLNEPKTAGEDYFLSYAMQQHLGTRGGKTFVPAQPTSMPEVVGSTQLELGNDEHALWTNKTEEAKKLEMHQRYIKRGWRPLFNQGKGIFK